MFLRNPTRCFCVFGILFGAIFLLVGLIFFLRFDPDAYDRKTTGTITEIEEYWDIIGGENELMHKVYIDYRGGGRYFRDVEYGGYDSSMKVGDEVEIWYMSDDPAQFTGSDKELAPYLGLGAALIGAVSIAGGARQAILLWHREEQEE